MARRGRAVRWVLGLFALLVVAAAALLAFAYWEATWDPEVNRAEVALADWPAGAPPVTVLLVSDTHVAGPDMPPARLRRIVDGLNALAPDLVVLAGDYISPKRVATRLYSVADSVTPLAGLLAPLGRVAVLGNHDHWAGTVAAERTIRLGGITLLRNQAVKRGPLIIGGLDDPYTGHDDIAATLRAMDALGPGPRVLLTHSPDVAPDLPEPMAAVLAGHTHCGQVSLPFIGPPVTMSRYGRRFACGEIHAAGQTIFVGAGVGTSGLPLRLGARPGVWLIRFGPKAADSNAHDRLAPGTSGP